MIKIYTEETTFEVEYISYFPYGILFTAHGFDYRFPWHRIRYIQTPLTETKESDIIKK